MEVDTYVALLPCVFFRRSLLYIGIVLGIEDIPEAVEYRVVESHNIARAAPVGVFFRLAATNNALGRKVVGLYLVSEQFAVGVAEAVD